MAALAGDHWTGWEPARRFNWMGTGDGMLESLGNDGGGIKSGRTMNRIGLLDALDTARASTSDRWEMMGV